MSFFKTPNFEKTAENVDTFLKTQISKLSMLTGIDIASPRFDSMPNGGSAKNGTEQKYTRALQAKEALEAIRYTMNMTTGVSPQILLRYYVKHEPVSKINRDCLIDHNSFSKLKKVALNQFAECWLITLEAFDFDEEDMIDLRIYDD